MTVTHKKLTHLISVEAIYVQGETSKPGPRPQLLISLNFSPVNEA